MNGESEKYNSNENVVRYDEYMVKWWHGMFRHRTQNGEKNKRDASEHRTNVYVVKMLWRQNEIEKHRNIGCNVSNR